MYRFLLVLLACCYWGVAHAQQVFESELLNAAAALRHHRAGFVVSKIAVFKHEALLYMKAQASTHTDHCVDACLDVQAYYLADFIELYCLAITQPRLTDNQREWIRQCFSRCTIDHPFFHDEDEERASKFLLHSTHQITPFSLDTDWEAAHRAVEQALRTSPYASLLDRVVPTFEE